MPYFVFLEFTDPRVRDFLNSLRRSLSGNETTKSMHITVRGPYETLPEQEILESLSDSLSGYGVVIGGAGTFETNNGFAVYLRVQSPVFSEIMWKPDFKPEEFGLNPHITVFETTSSRVAKAVEVFLRSERIEIFTTSLMLTVYVSKQLNLFEASIAPELQKKRAAIERWNVKPGIIHRATLLHDQLAQRLESDTHQRD